MSQDASQLSALIGRIYDCAVDPALWPATLEEICNVLDSPAGTLSVADFVTGQECELVNVGVAPEYLKRYREEYACTDLLLHGMLLRELDEPAVSAELVDDAELLESRIYREWAAPQGFRDVMMATILKRQARLGYLGVTRRLDQRRYDADDKRLMALLTPHVRRSLTIADLLEHKGLERERFAAALDALRTAVLLVDHAGCLVHANPAGEALLRAGDLLTLENGAVVPTASEAATPFRKARDTRSNPEGASVPLAGARTASRAVAAVLPFGSPARQAYVRGSKVWGIFIDDAQTTGPAAAEALGRLYGLTGGELRVLLHLMQGMTLGGIAKLYGLSSTTVKSHLKHLFEKTSTRRQAELVRLALASTPAIGPR